MAERTPAVSFDQMIQADRTRRQHEALANEIFGKNRQGPESTKPGNSRRGSNQNTSLASRVGIAKRSSSSSNVKGNNKSPFNPPSRPNSAASQIARTNKIASAVNNNVQANVVSGGGLSIRGTAGPFIVEASNFAPGTTAADIESALQNTAIDTTGANGLVTCRIIRAHPVVTAEITLTEKYIAESIVSTFNNQKADGRILKLQLLQSRTTSASDRRGQHSDRRDDLFAQSQHHSHNELPPPSEDVEMDNEPVSAPDPPQEPLSQTSEVLPADSPSRTDKPPSDNHSQSAPPRDDHQSWRSDGRNLDRDHPRDRDRERDREHNRPYDDRRYDRRDHRNDRPDNNYDNRGPPRPSYGNGMGGRGYPSGGRMYSDDAMRGGRGSYRGGGGGGYRGYR